MDSMARKRAEAVQLGENIRRYRKALGLSQEKLAAKCQLHRTYVGAVERGERNPSILGVIRITRALGLPPSALIEGIT